MPLSVVIGGQFGGEGKGAIVAYLAFNDKVDAIVKTGGPNSTHSFGTNGKLLRVRMAPCGANMGPSTIVYPPGCLIHSETLFSELSEIGFSGQVIIDPKAGVVDPTHINTQKTDSFYISAGSTLTGTGAASAERARRRLRLARDYSTLTSYLGDTQEYLADALASGKRVLVEGSQSFGLSNYHGDYPYTTSRDTSVGTFLGQIGLGPKYLDTIFLVVKCFPTRNLIGEGSLPLELPEAFIAANLPTLGEYGGGTYKTVGHLRRVALFDFEVVRRAVIANSPDYIALTGLDRLAAVQHESVVSNHYESPKKFIEKLQANLHINVGLQSWGPYVENIIDNRSEKMGGKL
jgi:adenylosuccinate synthase